MKRRKRGFTNRAFVLILTLALVLGCAIGGTVAWLTDETDPVVNTFTYGDINIELKETTGNTYEIVPGNDLAKDPKVTVKAESEDCWLFVKVDKNNWPSFVESDGALKVHYTIEDGWTELQDSNGNAVAGVYYREVSSPASDTVYDVIKDNTIYVSENLTKEEVAQAKAESAPSLTFKAYAVQKDGISSAIEAWNKVTL